MTLAIQGHPKRGSKVIEILEMLGGNNIYNLSGNSCNIYYIIEGFEREIRIRESIFDNENICLFTLEEFEEKFPYKIGDKVWLHYENLTIRISETITSMRWCSKDNCVLYDVCTCCNLKKYAFTPYKEETMEEKDEKSANHIFDTEIISFDIAQRDKYELDLQGKFKVVLREGKYYVERIKPTYPKTYEECCQHLGCDDKIKMKLIGQFIQLINARNAYWKLYGEEIGLDGPWEPDYDSGVNKYGIIYMNNTIQKSNPTTNWERHLNKVLEFPTEELRDAFFENFKDLIESCKELL